MNCFTIRFSVDGSVSEIQSGSHLFVDEEYKKQEITREYDNVCINMRNLNFC